MLETRFSAKTMFQHMADSTLVLIGLHKQTYIQTIDGHMFKIDFNILHNDRVNINKRI